jgi:hypothetical protein
MSGEVDRRQMNVSTGACWMDFMLANSVRTNVKTTTMNPFALSHSKASASTTFKLDYFEGCTHTTETSCYITHLIEQSVLHGNNAKVAPRNVSNWRKFANRVTPTPPPYHDVHGDRRHRELGEEQETRRR